MKPADRSVWVDCALLFVCGLAVRLLLMVLVPFANSPDGALNVEMAAAIRSGAWRDLSFFHPGYPALIALLPGSVEEGWGRLIASLAGCGLVLPVYLLGRELRNRRTAIVAAGLVVAWPVAVLLSLDVLNMMPYVLAQYVLVWFGWKMLSGQKTRWALWAGVSAAVAYYFRPEALVISGGLVVALILRNLFFKHPARRWGVAQCGVFLAVLIVGLAPYVGFLKWQTGYWTLSRYVSNLTAHTPAQPVRQLPHRLHNNQTVSLNYFLTGVRQHSSAILAKLGRNLTRLVVNWWPRLFEPFWLVVPLGLLMLYGLVSTGRTQPSLVAWLVWVMLLSLLVVALHGGTTRYLMPLLPVMVLGIAAGLDRLSEQISPAHHPSVLVGVSVVLVALMSPYALRPIVYPILGREPFYPLEYRLAGEHLRELPAIEGVRVMTRKTQVAHYAELPLAFPTDWSKEQVALAANQMGPFYLVLDQRNTLDLYPWLKDFWEGRPESGWKMVYEYQHFPALRVWLVPAP